VRSGRCANAPARFRGRALTLAAPSRRHRFPTRADVRKISIARSGAQPSGRGTDLRGILLWMTTAGLFIASVWLIFFM